MDQFHYQERDLLSGPHLLGGLLMLAGLFALLSPLLFRGQTTATTSLIVSIVALVLGWIIVSTYRGTSINFAEKTIKEYTSIGGYKTGHWLSMPAVTVVEVVSIRYRSTNTPNGISPTFSGEITEYRVVLFSDKPVPELSFTYSNRERAMSDATCLATSLNIPLEIRGVE